MHRSNFAALCATSTPSTRRLLDGVAVRTGPNRKKGRHKNQCLKRLDCWLTILLVLLAIVLAAAYYAYCVYGKSTRKDKETEPLMPVATATPMA